MSTSFHKVNNNAASTLNAAIDDNDLSLAVPTGEGAEFDTVAQYLTLGRSDTYNGEILDVASRSSDTFTVTTRGVDGTSATAHDAGDRVECLLVAAHITEIQDAINAIENGTVTLAKVITSGTAANTHTIADSATNTVVSALELYHMSSGTPAAGLGAKLILGAEDSNGDATAAIELHGYLTTVTNSSEQGAFLLRVKNAGSFMDALAITVAANTVTMNANQTTVNLFTSTTTAITIGSGSCAVGITGSLDVSGHVAFGATGSVSANNIVSAYENYTTTSAITVSAFDTITGLNAGSSSSASFNPIRCVAFVSTAQTYSGTVRGGLFQLDMNSVAATITTANIVNATVNRTGSGTITTLKLFNAANSNSSTTITTAYAYYAANPGGSTNNYGIYLESITGGATNNYAIYTNNGPVRFGDSVSMLGAANVLGDASTDLFTFTGRCILRAVTDAGPMTATGGSTGEIVRNTSDNKFYGCTVGHASAATWVAFN